MEKKGPRRDGWQMVSIFPAALMDRLGEELRDAPIRPVSKSGGKGGALGPGVYSGWSRPPPTL